MSAHSAMPLIDTHCHVNFENFTADLEAVGTRWREAGVVQLVHACCEPQEFASLQKIADQFPEVFISTGLHPLHVNIWDPELGKQINQQSTSDSRVVAIGETGMDLFKATNLEDQAHSFRSQIRTAQEHDLPLIIHCREAAEVTRKILQEEGPVQGVMHCWAGTPEETQWFLDLGMHVSFSGVATFKNATTVHESVRIVPRERLLVETDCPFLAPPPHRGKRNEPAFVVHVAAGVAQLRGEELEELAAYTTNNARRLFKLPV
jgi:TatD DNase family protein